MKYELWYSESECFGALLCEGDMSVLKGPDARLIWTVEANDREEAIQKRDEFLQRTGSVFAPLRDRDALQRFFASGVYRPGESKRSASRERTTRVTSVQYLDDDGNHHSVDVLGWVAVTPDIVARLAEAEIGLSMILGQIWFERPYRDLTSAPEEITVVDLHSYDGMFRMVQEFVGHIHDKAQVNELVSQRLGASVPHWRIVESIFLTRSSDAPKPTPIPREMLRVEAQDWEYPLPDIGLSRRQKALAALGDLSMADEDTANRKKDPALSTDQGDPSIQPRQRRQPQSSSTRGPREHACPCGSGKAFTECHGSE